MDSIVLLDGLFLSTVTEQYIERNFILVIYSSGIGHAILAVYYVFYTFESLTFESPRRPEHQLFKKQL